MARQAAQQLPQSSCAGPLSATTSAPAHLPPPAGFKASFLVPAAHATLTISALGSPGALSAAKALAGDAGVAAVQAEPRSGSQSRRSPGSPPGSAGAAAFAGAEDSPLGHEGLPGPQRRQAAGQQEALRLFGEQGELVTRLLQQLGQRDRQLEEKQRRVEEAERQLVDLRALHAAEVETQRRRCTALAARVRELEEQAEGSPHAAAPASPQRLRAARAGASAGAAAQPTTEAMVAPFNRRDASRALATLTKSEAWRSGLTSLLVGTRILELWVSGAGAAEGRRMQVALHAGAAQQAGQRHPAAVGGSRGRCCSLTERLCRALPHPPTPPHPADGSRQGGV